MRSCKNNTKISHLRFTQIYYFFSQLWIIYMSCYIYFLIILCIFPKNILLSRQLDLAMTILSKLQTIFQSWQVPTIFAIAFPTLVQVPVLCELWINFTKHCILFDTFWLKFYFVLYHNSSPEFLFFFSISLVHPCPSLYFFSFWITVFYVCVLITA